MVNTAFTLLLEQLWTLSMMMSLLDKLWTVELNSSISTSFNTITCTLTSIIITSTSNNWPAPSQWLNLTKIWTYSLSCPSVLELEPDLTCKLQPQLSNRYPPLRTKTRKIVFWLLKPAKPSPLQARTNISSNKLLNWLSRPLQLLPTYSQPSVRLTSTSTTPAHIVNSTDLQLTVVSIILTPNKPKV